MEISEQSKQAIMQFLGDWWHDLTWQAGQTVLGADLPHQTPEQLYDQLLGHTLRDIAAAAEGLLPDDLRGETQDAVQTVCEWMWARPGMPATYAIPAEWWATPLGYLVLRAHMWAIGDELLTISQAAERSGRSISSLSQLVDRGRLTGYRDPAEPNPTKATRVSRRQLGALKTTPRGVQK